jgi:hypothetical protein
MGMGQGQLRLHSHRRARTWRWVKATGASEINASAEANLQPDVKQTRLT